MCRASRLLMLMLALGGVRAAALAQDGVDEPRELSTVSADESVEAYLDALGLKEVLAQQLAERVEAAPARERGPIAERLAALYVELLTSADKAADRRAWEAKARALLDAVPDADTFELRISLARAVYQRAEETAERYRLRLASEEEAAEAEASLRGVIQTLTDVASKVHRRVETYERAEEQGRDLDRVVRDGQTLQELLGDARRLRSLAYYYAGWSYYYVDFLRSAAVQNGGENAGAGTGSGGGREALRCFGWLLGAPDGREATLDRVPKGLLKYEHIARSAIACGLVFSQRGNDSEAMKWLELVGSFEELPESVKPQLLPREIGVLAKADRWADVDRVVREARRDGAEPLDVPTARLLVVLALEGQASASEASRRRESELAKIGLGDLVLRGEIGHVIDLASRYGTASLGDNGFIARYVRAIKAYEDAKALDAASDAEVTTSQEPTRDPEIAAAYRAAGSLFAQSIDEPDAAQFPAERAKARLLAGMTLYHAGDLARAGDVLLAASRVPPGASAEEKNAAEEAMWGAIVALDRVVSEGLAEGGTEAAREKLAQTIALYVQTYPGSSRSATLLLRNRGGEGMDDEKTLNILLAVEPGSPVYDASRREAARLLYARFRAARGSATEKDFAAMRFVGLADELLAADKTVALGKAGEETTAAGERVIVRARQMLDALLSVSSPDAARAERVLQALRGVAAYNGLSLDEHRQELLFRQLQIALVKNEADQAEPLLGQLSAAAGAQQSQFVTAAYRLVFMRAVDAWKHGGATPATPDEDPAARARAVVTTGLRVIDGLGADDGVLSTRDSAAMSVYAAVAQAAAEVWKTTGETEARDTAIRMDSAILAASPNVEGSLVRLAETSEAAGEGARALECWRLLMAGRTQNTDGWYEARYHSLRLLAQQDPARARQAMDQFVALNPDFGPEPWRAKMRELEATLPPAAPPADATNGAPDGNGGAS